MKLINNMTDLSNQDIGKVLDEISKMVDTIYYGKVDATTFTLINKKTNIKRNFKIQIRYLKKYTRFDIWEENNEIKNKRK